MTSEIIPRALLSTAERLGASKGFSFVGGDGKIERRVSFLETAQTAASVAAALRRDGFRPGDRIGLIIPENVEFICSFFGALHGGFVPVPLAPPLNVGKLNVFLEQLRHISVQSGLSLIITSERIKGLLGTLLGGNLRRICTYKELGVEREEAPLANGISSESLAFLQFTSGSTAKPKGVALTHGNLSENADCMARRGIGIREEDIGCSWLPLFHDMGLIGFVICPVSVGLPVYMASPLSFVRRPALWLEMINSFRGTISFGPNFSYGLCVKRITDSELTNIDLSSWRIAGCGAEPVQERTLRSFADRFSAQGFSERAMFPTYGMAESTLGVSFPPVGRELVVDVVDGERMAQTQIAHPADSETQNALRIVGNGYPFEGHELAILSENVVHKTERAIGEIVIRGPSVMHGYYENPEANAETFHDGWLRTGDLGYLVQGEIFICGRKKEVIIISGRNYYPTDIEVLLGDIPGVRKGNIVAFGLSDVARGEETCVICAETKTDASDPEVIEKAIRAKVLEGIGIHVGQVLLLAPDSLPKTSSGKLQRTKTKEMFLGEEFGKKSLSKEKLDFIKHWAASQWSYLRKK